MSLANAVVRYGGKSVGLFDAAGRKVLVAAVANKHTLPDLPYDYGALEPVISAEIMRIHHQKHHAAYVANLCVAEEKSKEALATGIYYIQFLSYSKTIKTTII
jgi:lactam utilization protein B